MKYCSTSSVIPVVIAVSQISLNVSLKTFILPAQGGQRSGLAHLELAGSYSMWDICSGTLQFGGKRHFWLDFTDVIGGDMPPSLLTNPTFVHSTV